MSDLKTRPINWGTSTSSAESGTDKNHQEKSATIAGFSLDDFGINQEKPDTLIRPVDDLFEQIKGKVETRSGESSSHSDELNSFDLEELRAQDGLFTEEDIESAKNESYLQGVIDGEAKERDSLKAQIDGLDSLLVSLSSGIEQIKPELTSTLQSSAMSFINNAIQALLPALYTQNIEDIIAPKVSEFMSSLSIEASGVELYLGADDYKVLSSLNVEVLKDYELKCLESLSSGDLVIKVKGESQEVLAEAEISILSDLMTQVDEHLS
ncbi:hypothetical protein VCHA53O466_40310 [Vibrio chagasii]|nr:hypothetical protein VCHA53O466_40310 [Vibrio chagasii]